MTYKEADILHFHEAIGIVFPPEKETLTRLGLDIRTFDLEDADYIVLHRAGSKPEIVDKLAICGTRTYVVNQFVGLTVTTHS